MSHFWYLHNNFEHYIDHITSEQIHGTAICDTSIDFVALTPAITDDEPAPVNEHVEPVPAAIYAAVIEYVSPKPAVTRDEPALVIEYVTPPPRHLATSTIVNCVALSPAVSFEPTATHAATASFVIEPGAPVIEYVSPAPAAIFCSTRASV